MNLNPLHDRVVIKPVEAERTSAGGIVIPDNAQEKPTTGQVLAVGPGRRTQDGTLIATTVKPGDQVMYSKFTGQTITVDGQDLTVLKEEEIFAIVE